MNILIVSPQSPETSIGGVERHIKNLLDYCQNKPYKVVFLLPASGKKEHEVRGNIVIYRKRFLNLVPDEVFGKKIVPKKQTEKKSREFFEFINETLVKEKINIVDAELIERFSTSFTIALHMACFSKNIPAILRVHSFPTREIHTALINDLPWKKLICVSKSVAGDLFSKGTSIDKIDVKYLGINTKEFSPNGNKTLLRKNLKVPENIKFILHASRITNGLKPILQEKGIGTLLEAFSKIAPKYSDCKLLIATANPPEIYEKEFAISLEQLNNLIRLQSLEDRVICQRFKLEEMPKVYQGADVFVLASENETFGQVYLEAMSCGTPVIGTNVGGVPEIINDKSNGFLVPPNNASILSQRMDELISEPRTRESFIKAGLETVNNKFSSEIQFEAFFNYLKELIQEKSF